MIKFAALLVHILDMILPKRNAIVLRAGPDIEDQCISVLIALSKIGYKGPVTWLMADPSVNVSKLIDKYGLENLKLRIVKHYSVCGMLDYVLARYAFFTQALYTHPFWKDQKISRRKTLINMWHGMPIKLLWKPLGIHPPRTQALLATGTAFQSILCDLSGMPKKDVWITGLPRNDMLFFKNDTTASTIEKMTDGKSWFFYLPTYRRSGKNAFGNRRLDGTDFNSVLNMSDEDTKKLDAWLESANRKMIVKAHPFSIHAETNKPLKLKNIILITEVWLRENTTSLYELAGYAEGLITDISSILIDYLLLDRPIFIYFPDLKSYDTNRGFVFDNLEANLPAPPVENVNDLIDQIDSACRGNDIYQEQRRQLCKKFHTNTEPVAAERFLNKVGIRI